jgi:hypothetical protein
MEDKYLKRALLLKRELDSRIRGAILKLFNCRVTAHL